MEDLKTSIVELVNKLNVYANAYYNESKSLVSDEEYDKLFQRLLYLEAKTGFVLPDSPTQRAGISITDKDKPATLDYKCLSLNKTKSETEFMNYFGEYKGLYSLKLDGLTTQLTYYNGTLIKAVTRGNGIVGSDVLDKLMEFTNVPLYIDYKGILVVTGESLIPVDTFNAINEQLPNDEKYATCRNLASGTLTGDSASLCKERNMKFYVFNVNEHESLSESNLAYSLSEIKNLGFDVVPYMFDNHDGLSVVNLLKMIGTHMKLPFDGIVGVYNDIDYGKSLGETARYPRSGIAYKFEDEEYETKLKNIVRDVTRTGKISLVAEFDPVVIDGTKVQRALIPNYDMFKELQLGIGDTILVRKANMIIPQIVDNITRSNTYVLDDTCPCCGSKLSLMKLVDTTDYYCTEQTCKGSLLSKLVHFCSKEGMNIKGLSEATLKTFIEKGFVRCIVDIFNLTDYEADIISLNGFGATSYTNLVRAIADSRTVEIHNFIYALGIPLIGTKVSKEIEDGMIANNEGVTLSNLISASKYISTNVARTNYEKWFTENNKVIIDALLDEVQFKKVIRETKKSIFTGKKVCVTGTLENYTRTQIHDVLTNLGAVIVSSVSSNTDYLICGSKAGDKLNKAKKYGVTILYEQDLGEYLSSGQTNL